VANPEKIKKLRAMAKRRKLPFYEISAVTGLGIEELKFAIGETLRELPTSPEVSQQLPATS
jgi:GTPase